MKPCTECLFCYAGKRGDWVLELAADLATGMGQREAVETYPASAKTVTKIRRLAGVSGNKQAVDPQALQKAKGLLDAGSSYSEAERVTGVHSNTLRYRFPGMGWGHAKVSREKIEWAGELLDDGASYSEVSNTTGLDWGTLNRHFPGRGYTPQQVAERASIGRLEKQVLSKLEAGVLYS